VSRRHRQPCCRARLPCLGCCRPRPRLRHGQSEGCREGGRQRDSVTPAPQCAVTHSAACFQLRAHPTPWRAGRAWRRATTRQQLVHDAPQAQSGAVCGRIFSTRWTILLHGHGHRGHARHCAAGAGTEQRHREDHKRPKAAEHLTTTRTNSDQIQETFSRTVLMLKQVCGTGTEDAVT
jgi:hypothetical protein